MNWLWRYLRYDTFKQVNALCNFYEEIAQQATVSFLKSRLKKIALKQLLPKPLSHKLFWFTGRKKIVAYV